MTDIKVCLHCGAQWDDTHESGTCPVQDATLRMLSDPVVKLDDIIRDPQAAAGDFRLGAPSVALIDSLATDLRQAIDAMEQVMAMDKGPIEEEWVEWCNHYLPLLQKYGRMKNVVGFNG